MKKQKNKLQLAHFFKKIFWSVELLLLRGLIMLFLHIFTVLFTYFANSTLKIEYKLLKKDKLKKFDILEPFWVLLGITLYFWRKVCGLLLVCINKILHKITQLADKKNKIEGFPITEYYKPTGNLQYNLEIEPESRGKKRYFSYFITDWFFSTNHKNIGTLYLIFSTGAGIIGTVMSLFIRINLTMPGDMLFWEIHNYTM